MVTVPCAVLGAGRAGDDGDRGGAGEDDRSPEGAEAVGDEEEEPPPGTPVADSAPVAEGTPDGLPEAVPEPAP